MGETTKIQLPINCSTPISLKTIFFLQTKTISSFVYGFMLASLLFTVFLTFNPSLNTSTTSPWFSNIFPPTPTINNSNGSTFSLFTYLFSNTTNPPRNSTIIKTKPNSTFSSLGREENEELTRGLIGCDLYDGTWVQDDTYPLYKPGSCSVVDEQFSCYGNHRLDRDYEKLKWKPKSCTLPRLNASHMLEMLRGKRLVLVGDSLNRNMWESLVCILKYSVKDQSKVYRASPGQQSGSEATFSYVFEDYNCSVELFVSHFLVREWVVPGENGTKKETLRLDIIGETADGYKTADIIVFNTGHWWYNRYNTPKGKNYYQEGSHVYRKLDALEAFTKAITTWGRWVDANINHNKTLVFFRGNSASHFSKGPWNSGGRCDHNTRPTKNEIYLKPYPDKMLVLEKVLREMKTPVSYMNITKMTDYRTDGHPSIYRSQLSKYQDCMHWCLPGVPDLWNEILYAQILLKQYEKQQHQKIP